jgi:hypothetical protein
MSNVPRKTERLSDFDPSQFLATHEQHETKISDLTERTVKLEKHFATPQAAATFIEECAQDSRVFENVFAKMFCRFLNENPDVIAAVQKQVEESDRNFVRKTFKRFGGMAYAAVLILVGAAGKEIAQLIFSLFPHK